MTTLAALARHDDGSSNRHSEEAVRLTCLPPCAKASGGEPGRSLGVVEAINQSSQNSFGSFKYEFWYRCYIL
jgi:hypothetical protein